MILLVPRAKYLLLATMSGAAMASYSSVFVPRARLLRFGGASPVGVDVSSLAGSVASADASAAAISSALDGGGSASAQPCEPSWRSEDRGTQVPSSRLGWRT